VEHDDVNEREEGEERVEISAEEPDAVPEVCLNTESRWKRQRSDDDSEGEDADTADETEGPLTLFKRIERTQR
jgi:hypothetical protein